VRRGVRRLTLAIDFEDWLTDIAHQVPEGDGPQ
jgi:hypothetical protein